MSTTHADLDLKTASRIMRALGNQNRLALYLKIADPSHQACAAESVICDIATCLKIGAPTVSHHIKELEQAGLIITQRQGKLLTARVNPAVQQWVMAFFNPPQGQGSANSQPKDSPNDSAPAL